MDQQSVTFPIFDILFPSQDSFVRDGLRTWSLDVADDGTRSVVHELDADLGDTTAGAYKKETSEYR